MTGTLPLVGAHPPDQVLAWRPQGPVTVARYCADVRALAERLPPSRAIVNLCEDRYHFAVLLGACAASGRVSLQPPSLSAVTLQGIMDTHEDACAMTDHGSAAALPIAAVRMPALDDSPARGPVAMLEIAVDRVVAILFTSGSTGRPRPHAKTWGKLVASAHAEAAALGLAGCPHVLVGTVPAQHSYGFESTFLLALHGGCSFWSGRPFYPSDLAEALACVPRPRMVVTTPVHLAAFIGSGLALPAVDRWLSATAPLKADLAARVEATTGAPVDEIYGSTESSQLATRRTVAGPFWSLMRGVRLEQPEPGMTCACGGHVEGRVLLADLIRLSDDRRFMLRGRHADLIKIAGKRSSLAHLNQQLRALDGVRDAGFYVPRDHDPGKRLTRLAAFAVAPGRDRATLLAALRKRVDPAFMPRPLVLVDALPRTATGKLQHETLERLYAAWTRRFSHETCERSSSAAHDPLRRIARVSAATTSTL